MALSEIEKLERRYAENPQGLTFAPLAEVHRKNGDLNRALELLRPGLALHPDYIPASIVLGRCHLDLGDFPAAEAAFTHVLSLDGENVIALKALADIGERLHHFDRAERWLTALLAVDRSNEEARAQLERIETARRDAASAPPPPSLLEEPAAPATGTADAATGQVEEAPAGETSAPGERPVEPTPSAAAPDPLSRWRAQLAAAELEEIAPLPLEVEPTLAPDDEIEPPPPGLEIEESEVLAEPVEPLAGLIGRDVDKVELSEGEFRVELSEDIVLRSSGGHEFQVPDASAELSDRGELRSWFGSLVEPSGEAAASMPEEPLPESEPAELKPEPEAASMEAEVSAMALGPEQGSETPQPTTPTLELPGLEEPAAPQHPATLTEPPREPEAATEAEPRHPAITPEPELVVTESMAEVLLQQGHSAEALRVYRELEIRNAGDPKLLEKIAHLESEAAAGAGSAPVESVAPEAAGAVPPPETAAARRAFTAAETGGQSVRSFLQALLAARPAGAPAAPASVRSAIAAPADAGGAPTRPAPDALSLSSVFGEETTALPPAVPAAGGQGAGGVSFDDFYGAGGGGTAKPRTPDPKSDDLDQFHAWLQNLKR